MRFVGEAFWPGIEGFFMTKGLISILFSKCDFGKSVQQLGLLALLASSQNLHGSQKFNFNDRVQANTDASVRATAAGIFLYKIGIGSIGTIIGGPQTNVLSGTTYIWYEVHWDSGTADGWTAQDFLNLSPPVTVSPGDDYTPPTTTADTLTPKFTWNSVQGATGYGLYIRDVNANVLVFPDSLGITTTPLTGTSYTLPSGYGYLTSGKNYKWNLTSFSGTTEYVPPGGANFSRWFLTGTIPAPPSSLAVSGGPSAIGLGWNAGGANADGQNLERKDGDNGTWYQIASLAASGGGYADTNVAFGTRYYYRIYAYNGIGDSATNYSNGASLVLPVSISVTDPNGGQSLQAGDTYTISWTASGSTAVIASYDLAYSLDGGSTYSAPISGISSAAIGYSWTVPNCTATTQGLVRARAFDSNNTLIGNGANPHSFTINALPTGTLTAIPDASTTSPQPGQPVTFSGSRSQAENACIPITSYTWNLPGGSIVGQRVTVIFDPPSQGSISFNVSLTARDSAGNTSTAYLPITLSGWGQGVNANSSFSHDPVNLANGNYVYQHSGLRIHGKGFPFEFKWFYNSQFADQTGRPLGYGWTHSYNIYLSPTSTNATVTFEDGHSEIHFLSAGQYTVEPGVYDILTNNPDGTFTLIGKDQTRHNFDAGGRLTSIVDKNSNTLTLSYGGHVLTNIADTAGRQVILQSDANGCLTNVIDPIGRILQFSYDSQTNLVMAIDANLGTNTFQYDTNHQMTSAFDARGTRFVSNAYDDLQRIVTYQTDAYTNASGFSYDFSNRVTYVTNALGKVSVHRHDGNLLITNIVDEAGGEQFYAYDANRNRSLVQDKNGNQTHYSFDLRGNVTNKTDALTNVTTIQYDVLNNPIYRVDALTNITAFGYDGRGNLTARTNALNLVSAVQYDVSGLPIILTDARSLATTNQYDTMGNLIAVIDCKGFTNRFEYDIVGRKIRQIDALNRTNSFYYDNDDNVLYAIDPLGLTNGFTYDGNNNRTSASDPRGATVTNVYDLKDRVVGVLWPLNHTNGTLYDALDRKAATFDALGNPTRYAYDDIGNPIAVTNALGQATQFTYDPNQNQTAVIHPNGHVVTNLFDALNRKVATINVSISTNYTAYDGLGRILATTNANNQATQFFYDGIGRLTNVLDSTGKSAIFDYDENGNSIRTTDPNGHTWTNVFDELNRLVEQDDPQGHKTLFSYDPVGNLTNKITANGDSIVYSYDALNRLRNITYPTGVLVTFAYDVVGNRTNMTDTLGTTVWQYDLLNRIVSVTDPFGQSISNGFDANGNRVSLTYPGNRVVNYGFDALSRMMALTNWLNEIVIYAYDSRGNLIAETNANGTVAAFAYDVADRLVALTNAAPDASVIAGYALTLDAVGNHMQGTHNQPLFPILRNQTNSYTYDSDNRLLSADAQTVTHNANGDLTWVGTNLYSYDFDDRLVRIALTNSSDTFTYDALGNRLSRTVNTQSRRFLLDRTGALTQVLVETDTSNLLVAYYVYGLGLAQRISAAGTTATYHFDIHGSTVALTDPSGNITDSYAYDSFGVLANAEGDSSQPFHYLGRYGIVDDSTGLLYVRSRYFSPRFGRFFTKDVGPSKNNEGQGLNRFVYALNNPLRFRDATGLIATEGFFAFSSGSSDQAHANLLISGSALLDIAETLLKKYGMELKLETYVDTQYGGLRIGEYRITSDSSIDLRALAGALKVAGYAASLYSIYDTTTTELGSRGVTLSSWYDAVKNAPASLDYAVKNPDAALEALTEGITSATAADLKFLTFGVSPWRGNDIQTFISNNVNP